MRVSGVNYEIDWPKFEKGASITVPCLDPQQAKREVLEVTNRLRLRVHMKVIVEDGVRALRIWRV